MTAPDRQPLERAFDVDRQFLWSLCYRMTGNAADADDAVQETFVRALARPPARQDLPWRPWLVRVALNVSRDQLRKRRRERYVGPWLPSLVQTGDEATPPSYEIGTTEVGTTAGRYDLVESISFAFLIALEVLTPLQRAVLLLRDVFDYSIGEASTALDISAANVKTTLHRARRAMSAYDAARMPPTRDVQGRTRAALEQFLARLGSHDVPGIEAMLADEVRAVSDGGGEFRAALLPIVGREKVTRFFVKLSEQIRVTRVQGVMLNALPAVAVEISDPRPRVALRFVVRCEIDRSNAIVALHVVAASRKLVSVPFN